MITVKALAKWLASAPAGGELVYWEGPSNLPMKDKPGRDMIVAVRQLYNQGLVELYQRRAGIGFAYCMVKRAKRAILPEGWGFKPEHLTA